jgi:hypothetical protein
VDADTDRVGFHFAFCDHEHGVDFHLFGALDFAVDLVRAFVNSRAGTRWSFDGARSLESGAFV